MSYKWEHSGIFIQVEQSHAIVTVLISPFQLWLCVCVFVQLHSTRFPVVQNFSNLKRLVSLVPRLSLAAFMFSSAGGQRPKTQGPVCAASTSMGTYMKSTTLERHPDKIWQKLHLPLDWIGRTVLPIFPVEKSIPDFLQDNKIYKNTSNLTKRTVFNKGAQQKA